LQYNVLEFQSDHVQWHNGLVVGACTGLGGASAHFIRHLKTSFSAEI